MMIHNLISFCQIDAAVKSAHQYRLRLKYVSPKRFLTFFFSKYFYVFNLFKIKK